jgi:hypothetical protein
MHEEEIFQAVAFSLHEADDGWFVALPDKTLLGPYRNGELALEVAVAHALIARNQGVDAQIYVDDNQGGHHSCMILEHMNEPHRCAKCEASWSSSDMPSKCVLRAALKTGK